MGILKIICAMSFLLSLNLRASPPVDLSNPDDDPTLNKERSLTEDDLVYTDTADKSPTFAGNWGHVLVDVYGLNLPVRDAKILANLNRGERVEILRLSKDKKWYAVLSLRSHRKVWVPHNTIKALGTYKPSTAPKPSSPAPGKP